MKKVFAFDALESSFLHLHKHLSRLSSLLLVIPLGLLISGCQKEGFNASSQKQNLFNQTEIQKLQKKFIPFKATFKTVLANGIITGTGEGTHIGRSTLVVVDNDANFPLLTGTQTITAANGDQIFSSHSGSAVGPNANGIIYITLYNKITGGTGRFVGATGSFTAHAFTNLNTSTGSVSFEGTISIGRYF